LGDALVGKTTLVTQYLQKTLSDDYIPTIEERYTKIINKHESITIFEIGPFAFLDEYIQKCQGFILIYSITSTKTFKNLSYYYEKIAASSIFCETPKTSTKAPCHKCIIKNVPKGHEFTLPIMLVGNKSDLESRRKVSTLEGSDLAHQWSCRFFETSASTCSGVDVIFEQIIKDIKKRRISSNQKSMSGHCVIF
jgi:GTPase SAR1 family protein